MQVKLLKAARARFDLCPLAIHGNYLIKLASLDPTVRANSIAAFTSAISYVILTAADRIRLFLGETGIRILTRMMGLLLTAIAVQFVLNGLKDVGVVG